NEFYGIYGAGSSIRIAGSGFVTGLVIRLLHFRTFLLLRNVIATIREELAKQSPAGNTDLMEQMARDQLIPFHGPAYEAAEEQYRSNIRAIVDVAHARGVPVIFSALVSNVKDLEPFRSEFSPSLGQSNRLVLTALLTSADSLQASNRIDEARAALSKAVQIDTNYADAWFKLGRIEYEKEDYRNALADLWRAKDLDALRFRASEEFQNVLKQECLLDDAVVSPVDSVFESNSPHGIVGNELILEHLHPNLAGYRLMGETWTRTIAEKGLLGKIEFTPPSTTEIAVGNDPGATIFDERVGEVRIAVLTHKWPFPSDPQFRFIPRSTVDSLALRYAEGRVYWSDARYALADYFVSVHNYHAARLEYLTIGRVIPYSYQPFLRAADTYLMEGKMDSAALAYRRCIAAQPNPYAYMKLAIMAVERHDAHQAVAVIDTASLLLRDGRFEFSPEANASRFFLLGFAHAQIGEYDTAIVDLRRSLSYRPLEPQANALLRELENIVASRGHF
ncbi:MAG TPA: hypothetical protein VMM57_01875, partial [Bacteroidota bacterium]|nr:hypothetical protein [Bacteroidota bacterium]